MNIRLRLLHGPLLFCARLQNYIKSEIEAKASSFSMGQCTGLYNDRTPYICIRIARCRGEPQFTNCFSIRDNRWLSALFSRRQFVLNCTRRAAAAAENFRDAAVVAGATIFQISPALSAASNEKVFLFYHRNVCLQPHGVDIFSLGNSRAQSPAQRSSLQLKRVYTSGRRCFELFRIRM